MNKAGIAIIVVIALVIGYGLGKKETGPTQTQRYPVFVPAPSEIDTSEHEEKLEEIRSRLEDARDSAEQARDAADDAAFQAQMRWLETGRVEDMMRMNDADEVLDRADESLSNVDDALSNAE